MSTSKNVRYSKGKRFTFISDGTGFSFDPQRNATLDNKLSNLLQVHIELVKLRNSPTCFILTDTGKVLSREEM